MVTKMLKELRTALAEGQITQEQFDTQVNAMCDQYGTEYVAERWVALVLA